jgi:vacuolar protein sorting-associated protein 3
LSFCSSCPPTQEIPSEPAYYTKRSGQYLCFAGRTNYSVLDLSTSIISEVLPISQLPPDSGGPRIKPIIAVIAQNEFLILSWNGASTMGVFINEKGDAIRGILEWSGHPLAVCTSTLSPFFLLRAFLSFVMWFRGRPN